MFNVYVKQTRKPRAVVLFYYEFADELGNVYTTFTSYGFQYAVDIFKEMVSRAGGYPEMYNFIKIKQ